MKWQFTTEQVAKGEVRYGLEEFRRDFRNEVNENFSDYSKQDLEIMFHVAYDVCYCCAVRQELAQLLEHCRNRGLKVEMKFLELIRDANLENIEMLKAVFACKVAAYIKEGLSNEDALKKLEEYHAEILRKSAKG